MDWQHPMESCVVWKTMVLDLRRDLRRFRWYGQSCIFDLGLGSATIRPDAKMGYEACLQALEHPATAMGNVGAGTGATVGKLCGMERASKTGIGCYAMALGELQMAAVVVVNALGDIFDPANGTKIAGLMNEDRTAFGDSCEELWKLGCPQNLFTGNTTIGAVITNGPVQQSTDEQDRIHDKKCLCPLY